jgi:hypothetical protein
MSGSQLELGLASRAPVSFVHRLDKRFSYEQTGAKAAIPAQLYSIILNVTVGALRLVETGGAEQLQVDSLAVDSPVPQTFS